MLAVELVPAPIPNKRPTWKQNTKTLSKVKRNSRPGLDVVCRKRRCQSLGYPYTVRKELTFTSISTLYPAFNSFFFFARSFVNESSGLRHSKSGEIAAHSIRGRAGLSFLLLLSFYQSTRPLFLYTFSYIACFLSCLASLLFVFFVFFLPSRAFRWFVADFFCWLFLRSIFMNGVSLWQSVIDRAGWQTAKLSIDYWATLFEQRARSWPSMLCVVHTVGINIISNRDEFAY